MSAALFRLRNVPDDEAAEVRALLSEHDIIFRETSAGFLGIGTAAIWVDDPAEHKMAQQILADYQLDRALRSRTEYLQKKVSGEHTRFIDLFRRDPAKFAAYVLIAAVLLYLSTRPFFGLN